MKLNFKKIVLLVMVLCLALGSFTACSKKELEVPVALPEYSADLQFEFSGYHMTSDGTWERNGENYFYGEDFRSEKRFAEMLDCGFTMLRVTANYRGESWSTSDAKKCMDEAYKAGFRKLVLYDGRLSDKCWNKPYGESDSEFESQEAFDAWVKECLSSYINEPGFYGLSLLDEPSYKQSEAYGMVYNSIRRVAKKEFGMDNIYLHCNFLPIGATSSKYGEEGSYKNQKEMYYNYLSGFMDSLDCDRISVDTYAFRGYSFYPGFYSSIQVLANEASRRDMGLSYCLQSYETTDNMFRRVDKSDMRLEMNSLVGFGATHLFYYSYFPHLKGVDEGAFVTRNGEKTNIWYAAQELMSDMQKFAPVILNYKYKGAKMYMSDTAKNYSISPYLSSATESVTETTLDWDNSYEFNRLKNVKTDNDIVLSTELYDNTNDLYMYMVQNIINPIHGKIGETSMTVSVEFGEEYDWVAEFDCGELRYVPLEDGVYKTTLSAGYAVYLIPLKSA